MFVSIENRISAVLENGCIVMPPISCLQKCCIFLKSTYKNKKQDTNRQVSQMYLK